MQPQIYNHGIDLTIKLQICKSLSVKGLISLILGKSRNFTRSPSIRDKILNFKNIQYNIDNCSSKPHIYSIWSPPTSLYQTFKLAINTIKLGLYGQSRTFSLHKYFKIYNISHNVLFCCTENSKNIYDKKSKNFIFYLLEILLEWQPTKVYYIGVSIIQLGYLLFKLEVIYRFSNCFFFLFFSI